MIVYTCPSCDEMGALQDAQGGTLYACLGCGQIRTVPVKPDRTGLRSSQPPHSPEPPPPSEPPPPASTPTPPPLPPRHALPPGPSRQSAPTWTSPHGPGMATTAMTCGLLGMIPCFGIALSMFAIILGVISLTQERPGRHRAIVGIVAGVVTSFMSAAFGWFLMSA